MDARLQHGRRPAGAENTTMLLWHAMNDAGDAGITRDELVAVVGPRINAGHARRRYLVKRLHRYNSKVPSSRRLLGTPTFEDTDPDEAKRFLITATLDHMRDLGTATRDEQRHYRVGRKPRAARYQQDDAVLDPSGVRTRMHMGTNEALRVLNAFAKRRRASYRAQLTGREFKALERLLELADEELRSGFPTWLPTRPD
jgi:hypothetical protein